MSTFDLVTCCSSFWLKGIIDMHFTVTEDMFNTRVNIGHIKAHLQQSVKRDCVHNFRVPMAAQKEKSIIIIYKIRYRNKKLSTTYICMILNKIQFISLRNWSPRLH